MDVKELARQALLDAIDAVPEKFLRGAMDVVALVHCEGYEKAQDWIEKDFAGPKGEENEDFKPIARRIIAAMMLLEGGSKPPKKPEKPAVDPKNEPELPPLVQGPPRASVPSLGMKGGRDGAF